MWATDTIGVYDVFNVPTVKSDEQVTLLARGMRDLYAECLEQIISDDEVIFHLAMMPDMTGSHLVHSVRSEDDEDFATSIATILDVEIRDNDCIVILGKEMLTVDRTEDDMLEIVLTDIALHLNRLWSPADATTGWAGHYIGRAAIASVIAASHDVLKMPTATPGRLTASEAIIDRIADMANTGILNDYRIMSPAEEAAHNRPAFDAIETICTKALETQGSYTTLPAPARSLCNTAKAIFHDVVDDMARPPRVLL